jgi:hypothetical protein
MKRTTLLLLSAIVSAVVTCYAVMQFFVASVASSALVGVQSQATARHHYSAVSWIWFAVAVAAVFTLVVSVIGVVRLRSTSRIS